MPAHQNPVSTEKQMIVLPTALVQSMHQHLFNDEKGRIPKGAISNYIAGLIKKDLAEKKAVNLLDLMGANHE
jgi:hypothetical protein